MIKEIYQILKSRFIIMCVILLTLVVFIFLNHRANINNLSIAGYNLTMISFISSAVFAVCVPIVLRLLAFRKVKNEGSLKKQKYLQFKTLALVSIFIGALFALYGYYELIYEALLTVAVLCVLYGIYSVLPNRKTLKMELIEFNVEDYRNNKERG